MSLGPISLGSIRKVPERAVPHIVSVVVIAVCLFAVWLLSPLTPQKLVGLSVASVTEPDPLASLDGTLNPLGKQRTPEQALDGLMRAEGVISEMEGFNLSTFYIRDMLLHAKRAFVGEAGANVSRVISTKDPVQLSYLDSLQRLAVKTPAYEVQKANVSEVFEILDRIDRHRARTIRVFDTIGVLESQARKYQSEGGDISYVGVLLGKAKGSLKDERLNESEEIVKKASLELEGVWQSIEMKGQLVWEVKTFFKRYGGFMLAGLVVLAGIAIPLAKRGVQWRRQKREELMHADLRELEDLMRKAEKK